MNKILLIALVFFGLQTQAQIGTDLEFSQILTLEGISPTQTISCENFGTTPSLGSVPSGKVWKVLLGGSVITPPLSNTRNLRN